eukprot:CAMPEP_0172392540 /NCGR_PEP_ID=MMETSP1061-20121228/8647_1 /TAXON_ID=37318 /ORGANISM="Pseudo-nitzschia pungens, Strain cf. pungens" /LENGTH=238 /DNA_ID=CAMNT_0013123401 /DNA_START=335 /DNA_END=1048 /DNA_ORIENTATION=-
MSCSTELTAADTCVQGDEACKTCFDPGSFKDTYPGQAENFFRSALAFASPNDSEFCVEANWRICKKYYPKENGEASCCCLKETKEYTKCMFGTNGNGWLAKFFVTDTSCEYGGCEIFDLEGTLEEEVVDTGGGGSSVIIIGGGAGGAVLIAVLVVCLYLRKRRLAAVDADDDDEEKGKKKKGKKDKDKDDKKDKKKDKKEDNKKKDKKKDKKKKKDDSDEDGSDDGSGDSDDSDAKSK